MTERVDALWVALEQPIREDDIKPLVEAIQQLRGVMRVEPAQDVGLVDEWVARHRAYQAMHKALWLETFGAKKGPRE